MQWLKLEVRVRREHVEGVEALLESLGALSITLTDTADIPVLEPGVGETPLWPDVAVTGLFDEQADVRGLELSMSKAPGVDSHAQISLERIADRNWQEASREHARAMKFGTALWIVPGEMEAPEPDATVVRMNAGLAFGSGTHPTTRLCLEWLDTRDLRDRVVIDFGCGSGVLGIAAAMKGARRVICVDNDPQALVSSRDNAAQNGVADRVEVLDAEQFDGDFARVGADVVVANILSGTLIELAPRLCASLRVGGTLALSGILEEQAKEVTGGYNRWVTDWKEAGLEGWVMISGTKCEHEIRAE